MSVRRMNRSQLLKEPRGTVQAYVMHEGRPNWCDIFFLEEVCKNVPVSMVTEHVRVHLVRLTTGVLSMCLSIA